MSGTLLLVIPPVVRMVNGVHEVEVDFSNNLKGYLTSFSHVSFACPVAPARRDSGILKSLPVEKVTDADRLTFIPLPYAYREDRYLRHYLATRRLLRSEIAKSDYLLFSPHAKYDWSTLAARQAINMGRKYDMESDWDQRNVQRVALAGMPFGLKKIRKILWARSHSRAIDWCFSKSSLALLQGQDVFDAYKEIAPNPFKVLNVQVSADDHIPSSVLRKKLTCISEGQPLILSYAGRMIEMKGPGDWLKAIAAALQSGANFRATWFGEGSLMSAMRQIAEDYAIKDRVTFVGVIDRDALMARLHDTDIFLFCHKTNESPRCLSEALAAGCAIVGYGSGYSRELVATHGGGEFVNVNDWESLAKVIVALDRDRPRLARLVEAAAASGRLLDRNAAIQHRIDLIKTHLCPSIGR
jgi:colanic acid/amylovoran biosynthesis glycosyltransferase